MKANCIKIIIVVFVNCQIFSQNTKQLNTTSVQIITPIDNTNLGYNAGHGGRSNTSIGYEAGNVVRSNFNTFIGDSAGRETTYGDSNVFVGSESGMFNTGGRENVFIGRASGVNNTDSGNIFLGFKAGHSHNTGWQNVFIGTESGKNSFKSRENVFLGALTGFNNFSGNENVFIGFKSGYENQNGNENTFLGSRSGTNNQTGNRNTFLGFYTGLKNTIGNDNTIIGYRAGSFNVSGSNNIFLGYGAGVAITSGNRNVIIGNSEGRYHLGNTSNKFIVHSIGSNTRPLIYGDFTSGNVSIGSLSTNPFYKLYIDGYAYASGMWINGQAQGTNLRSKTSSISNVLDKINTIGSLEQHIQTGNEKRKSVEKKNYILDANTLEKVFPDLVKKDKEQTAINYQGLIPILVEAVKELKKENEELQQRLDDVVSLFSINNEANQNEHSNLLPLHQFKLSQNTPNPVRNTSTITYSVPSGYENATSIKIFELGGREIKEYTNLKVGENQIIIKKGTFPSGIYAYSLMLNNKAIFSKRIVIK